VHTLTSISEFFGAAAEAADAIADRFRKVDAMLHSASVHFVLVTTTEEDRLREADALVHQMEAAGLRLAAIVLNRMLDERSFDALMAKPRDLPKHLAEIPAMRSEFRREATERDHAGADGLDALVHYLEDYAANQRNEIERSARFARELPVRVGLAIAPEIDVGVRDLRALAKVATILSATNTGRSFLENAEVAFGIATPRAPRKPKGASRRAAR
jgi:anion-transporting  ArsA/GET3 family ATPase